MPKPIEIYKIGMGIGDSKTFKKMLTRNDLFRLFEGTYKTNFHVTCF